MQSSLAKPFETVSSCICILLGEGSCTRIIITIRAGVGWVNLNVTGVMGAASESRVLTIIHVLRRSPLGNDWRDTYEIQLPSALYDTESLENCTDPSSDEAYTWALRSRLYSPRSNGCCTLGLDA